MASPFTAIEISSEQCNLDSDHTKLGRCLRPWLDLWEMIRVQEAHAANLVYPIPFYSRESVLFLCSAYLDIRSTCMTAEVLKKCKKNEMIFFVQRHMRHYCGKKAKLALEKFNCLHRVLMLEQHCWRHIQEMNGRGKCRGMPMFVNCILPGVQSKCQNSGTHVLVDAITSFGCALEKELVQQSINYVAKMNNTGEFTEEAARRYIRNELSIVLPTLDEERNARPTIQRYMTNNYDTSRTTGMRNDQKANSTSGLFSRAVSEKKKQIYEPARKIDFSSDYVEENTFLESDPEVEIALGARENALHTFKTKPLTCTMKQEDQIAQCYEPMIKLWNRIQNQHRSFGNILSPFLNYYPEELSDLCDHLDYIFDSCLTNNLINSCQDNTLIKFVDKHFGVICLKTWAGHLLEPFACVRKVINNRKECIDIIPHNSSAGTIVCDQMSHFFNCLLDDLRQKCIPEAQSFFADTISNFGCVTHLTHYKSHLKKTNMIQTRNKVSYKKQQKASALNGARRHSVKILDGELFSYHLSMECTTEMQNTTRLCIQPLIVGWKKIGQQRPMLKYISFPMYKYTRQELLELCDHYANAFLCAGLESIKICLNDEMVRFARDHFGYICTPQNIQHFMEHYECIVEATTANSGRCQIFITGIAEPGKDSRKCRGIQQYYNCVKSEILWKCRNEALKEFERSIIEYGCDLGFNDSMHS